MSWSTSGMGKVPALSVKIEKSFENGSRCTEPEEGVRQAARSLIAAALAAQTPGTVVKVFASGSQSTSYAPGDIGNILGQTNYLHITIEPQYGFVE